MEDDRYLLQYLVSLVKYGFCLVVNSPAEEGQIEKLQDRIAFSKLTHYG